jgi:tRNA threonylcarbamoyladenosine modification (KEOPS) complex  Pcc1 subunit
MQNSLTLSLPVQIDGLGHMSALCAAWDSSLRLIELAIAWLEGYVLGL